MTKTIEEKRKSALKYSRRPETKLRAKKYAARPEIKARVHAYYLANKNKILDRTHAYYLKKKEAKKAVVVADSENIEEKPEIKSDNILNFTVK